jgi:MFS family permease
MPTFQLIRDTKAAVKNSPPQIFNWYLFVCTWLWSLPGVSKGFDEGKFFILVSRLPWLTMTGNIASIVVLSVFRKRFGVDDQSDTAYADTKGWIVSIATAGAVFGCLSCLYALQKFGRKPIMAAYTVIYMAGVLGQTFCGGSLAGLYASRFIGGFGIGTMTILPSVHVSEVSPHAVLDPHLPS